MGINYMPHERRRHALTYLKKLASLWPAVGITGPRQVGKSTLVTKQLGVSHTLSLDDEDVLDDALRSAKVFLAKQEIPLVLDEVQKAPKLFDALKSVIDRARRPGSYFLTGSTEFSARLGIRESLTGRIGILRLHPMTMAESLSLDFRDITPLMNGQRQPRLKIESFASAMTKGGLPMPLFLRDDAARSQYWQSWLDTTVHRDMARLFQRSYDPRITFRILRSAASRAREGALFGITDITGLQARQAKNYIEAMENVFLLQRVSCHAAGVGKDCWTVFDSGLLNHLAEGTSKPSEGLTLALARQFLRNEIQATAEYGGHRLELEYFKSAKGQPVDFIWEDTPIKIISSSSLTHVGWEERALRGAMKVLKSDLGIITAPIDRVDWPKGGRGIAVVP